MSEIDNLKRLDHPNVIRLYETFETSTKLFLVQELLMGEELYQRIQSMQFMTEEYARKIFR